MSYTTRGAPLRYGFGLAMVVGAVLLRFALQPLLGPSLPFLTMFSAVVLAAWFGGWKVGIFATLLIGRHAWGWRGKRALRWTLAGFALLILAYVGSRFVAEVILGRV